MRKYLLIPVSFVALMLLFLCYLASYVFGACKAVWYVAKDMDKELDEYIKSRR